MAQYGGMYGQGFGYSPQEQSLSYGQRRYMRNRPSLTQQAEYAGGYAVPLYAAEQQRQQQQQQLQATQEWQNRQQTMFEDQMKATQEQFDKGQISEQQRLDYTTKLQKQFQEESQRFQKQYAEQQLAQQKLQGGVGMGLQAVQVGMNAYKYGPKIASALGNLFGGAGAASSYAPTAAGGLMQNTQIGQFGNQFGGSYGGTMSTNAMSAGIGAGVGAAGGVASSQPFGLYGGSMGTNAIFGSGSATTVGGAGAGMATGYVAGPLAAATMLSQTHRPFEWAAKNTMFKLLGGDDKGYSPAEYSHFITSGGRAARDRAAPSMAYNSWGR